MATTGTPFPAFGGTFANGEGTALLGAADGNDAQAGFLGEHIASSSVGIVLTTGTTASGATMSLSAGDWDIKGACTFVPTSTTTVAAIAYGFSTTASFFKIPGDSCQLLQLTFATGTQQVLHAGPARFNLATSTTVYANVSASFGVAGLSASINFDARRVR